jgi:prepilin-type N-terminal cleavage/methylation domain-containing protein
VRGFTMVELVVVVAIAGLIMAVSTPMFLSYWRTSALKAGAEELSAVLNNARQLAIKENTSVCVSRQGSNRVRYHLGTCAGAVWTGVGTDASGDIRFMNNIQVTNASADVVFTYLGAASTAGTFTVRNPVDGRTMSVIVASTGRVRIGP